MPIETAGHAWQLLLEGNRRFASGAPLHPRQAPDVRAEVASGQHPFAAIVGCSDSRVPAEIIFDCGLGDLFVVRTAGQVLTQAGYASLEFAVVNLRVQLIVVLGHSKCGAVTAALEGVETAGYLRELLAQLRPLSQEIPPERDDRVRAAIEENVRRGVDRLSTLDPVLERHVKEERLHVQGAVYELETGLVTPVLPLPAR